MKLVPAKRTEFSPWELIYALRNAWHLEMGGTAPNSSIAVLCAHIALETTNGRNCWNWNLGNYKRYADLDWQQLKTWEVVDGKDVPQICDFAVFQSLTDGAQKFISSQYLHWEAAWHWCCVGDPRSYAYALYNQRPPYFTASPIDYAAGCERWFKFYMGQLAGDTEDLTQPDLSDLKFAVRVADFGEEG